MSKSVNFDFFKISKNVDANISIKISKDKWTLELLATFSLLTTLSLLHYIFERFL